MSGLVKAADVGVFTRPPVTQAQWERARDDHGVELAIVGVWSGRDHQPNPAPESLANARKAGLDVAIYAVTNRRSGSWTVNHALDLADHVYGDDLRFICLDVEVVGAPLSQAQFEDAMGVITDLRVKPLIYSGKWYWDGPDDRHMRNPQWASAAGVPLWASLYDGQPNLDFPVKEQFGGWESLVGKQWTFKGERQLGFLGDLSSFHRGWMTGNP